MKGALQIKLDRFKTTKQQILTSEAKTFLKNIIITIKTNVGQLSDIPEVASPGVVKVQPAVHSVWP